MPLPVPFQPGDVIRASDLNALIDEIVRLQGRVSDLENQGSSLVRVISFEPPDAQEVRRQLIINGTGFAYPPVDGGQATNEVVIAGQLMPASAFVTVNASTSRIILTLPSSLQPPGPGFPPLGQEVNVQIRNLRTAQSAIARYVLLNSSVVAPLPDPVITAVGNPPSGAGSIRLGQPVTVLGSNFGTDPSPITVDFVLPNGGRIFPNGTTEPAIAVTRVTGGCTFTMPTAIPNLTIPVNPPLSGVLLRLRVERAVNAGTFGVNIRG